MTQTFLGFCLSQLCMFLHTANKLWRLGAWREGQLHSETWEEREEGWGKELQKNRKMAEKRRIVNEKEDRGGGEREREGKLRHRGRFWKTKKVIKSKVEEKGEADVSNSTAAAEQHNTTVATMSHLLETQRLPQADRGGHLGCFCQRVAVFYLKRSLLKPHPNSFWFF